VWTQPGRVQCGRELGPGNTDKFRVQTGFGRGSNDSNQTLHRTFRAFSVHSVFAEIKLFVAAAILFSWHSRAGERNSIDFIFSRILAAASYRKEFELAPYKLGIWYLCTVPQTPYRLCSFIPYNWIWKDDYGRWTEENVKGHGFILRHCFSVCLERLLKTTNDVR
jgi:hypothetical protein